jgi:membrane fusion protein (multidrug efflux system)
MCISYRISWILILSLVCFSGFAQDEAPLEFMDAGGTLSSDEDEAGLLALECLLEPFMTVNIGSPVPGALSAVMVSRGDVVRNGQPVARVDSRVRLAAVEMAKARAEYTKRRVARNEELYKDDLLSSQEKDEMETDALMAELELMERQTQVEIRWIRSPFNGVVVERFKGPGEYVQEAEIMELAQIDPLNVEVVMPVQYYGQIKPGMSAKVRPQGPIGGSYDAKVKVIDKVIDAASGTFGVRLEIPNPGNKVPAGLRCEVDFTL